MGKKDALFLSLCVLGLLAVGYGLLRKERIRDPKNPIEVWTVSHETNSPTSTSSVATKPHDPWAKRDPQPWTVTRDELNEAFSLAWKEQSLQVAPRVDDLAYARRLSLGLTGTAPSYEEIRALEDVPEDQRIAWWLAHVLEDQRFADYTAERFARAYIGTEDGPFIVFRRRRFVAWLSEQIEKNVPYNEIVRHLVSDHGVWTDNPSINFISASCDPNKDNQPDVVKLTIRTCRALLGMRIDCLQCHDDHLGSVNFGTTEEPVPGKQRHFHELAAFYGNLKTSALGIRDDKQREYQTQYLKETESHAVQPQAPFRSDLLDASGSNRERLAKWITHPENRAFSREAVNRVWAILFGKPLVTPIDDIPLQGPYPPGLELLASDFTNHGYDLRRLIMIIATSEPYLRSSRADFEITSEHEQAYASFPLSRLRPDQVAGSLVQSASLHTLNADTHVLWRLLKFFQTNQFVERYGDAGEDEFTQRPVTITQRLLMMNGELMRERTRENIVLNAATRVALIAPTDERAIEVAYLACLTRRPTVTEQSHFLAELKGRQGKDRIETLEDIYWDLMNSTEFAWNH